MRNLSYPDLDPAVHAESEYTLRKVRKMSRKALCCPTRGRDENACCDHVVRLMVRLALWLFAEGEFCI
jgi:hypothetical protein